MPELVDYLFQEKLSTVDFSDLTEAGWRCFETCFRMVNGHKGAIEKAEVSFDSECLKHWVHFDYLRHSRMRMISLLLIFP